MGEIIAFIWKVGLLWWTGNSNFLSKKFKLDFFLRNLLSQCVHNITELKDFTLKRSYIGNSDD